MQAKKRMSRKEKERFLRYWQDVSGEVALDWNKAAPVAIKMGWPVPSVPSEEARVAKSMRQVARETVKHDEVTGEPYRVYLANTIQQGDRQLSLWYDIDHPETKRSHVHKALIQDREQLVGAAVQMQHTENHWNRTHPDLEPIAIPKDLEPDVEWRINEPKKKAS